MDICIKVDALILRNWSINDVFSLSCIGNNDDVEATMNDGFPKPFTEDRAIKFIENAIKSNDLFLAIEKSGNVVESIGAFFEKESKSSAVIAYFIGKNYWNQGYASSAVKGIMEYLINEKKIKVITADPFEMNIGSRKVLERNGFRLKEIVMNGNRKGNKFVNTCKYEYIIKS